MGDLTGFAAATYLRGMAYAQVPTTLLSAVDASVGGKTALNLPAGKNLVGSFWQPSLVWCDPDTLGTLPESVFRDGCAEVIKYALLGDANLFESLKNIPATAQDLESVISRCIAIKRDLVAQDERDHGARRLLNLGHTVGHAAEACSAYRLTHGQCVSIGLSVITRAAAELGYCPDAVSDEVTSLLQSCGLPVKSPYRAEDILHAAGNDKKIHGGMLTLAVPESVGHCRLVDIPAAQFGKWLYAGGIR